MTSREPGNVTLDPRGLILGAMGVVLMCCMDAVVRALGAELTTFQIVLVRMYGAAIWLCAWIAITRGDWPRLARFRRHLLRGAMLLVVATLFFYAASHLPLAVCTALAMTAPVYVTVLAALIFKEPISPRGIFALGLGLLGSAAIIFGGKIVVLNGASDLLAWGSAVIAPLVYASTLVVMKHHSKDEGAAAMSLGQSVVAGTLALPLALLGAIPEITPSLSWQIPLVGFLGAMGYLFFINGLQRLPVSVFAVLDYTALIWASLLGFIFYSELPGAQVWVGGALIITACVLTAQSVPKSAPPVAATPPS
jgi:drug/metabolite transporter (DMT)-like permease